MSFADLREFLDYLRQRGELVTIPGAVDPVFGISAWIRRTSDVGGPAVYFPEVAGHDMPVVGGIFANARKALLALETEDHGEAVERYIQAIDHPIPPVIVDQGPCQEVVLRGADVDLLSLPFPTYSEQDGGAFMTVGIGIAKTPETGARNAGVYRMQRQGRDKLGLAASPYADFDAIRRRYEDAGKPMDFAVALGVDPVIQIATQSRVGYGVDEFGIAGALRGAPVELVRCLTVDLEVPATAEIVIEGRFQPGVRLPEGPFGEFTGYVGPGNDEPVFEVSAVTMRTGAIFQAGLTGVPVTENHVMKGLPLEAALLAELRKAYPEVTGVSYAPEGGCEFLVVVGLRQRYAYQARNIIMTALGSTGHPKVVIVTDDDVDIHDITKVWWAILTRCQPAEDLIVIPKAAGGQLDPSAPEPFVSSVLGIDATRPLGGAFPEVVRVPGVEALPDPRTLIERVLVDTQS
jgi:4-hydroxy-3-polyprenylbenzoate decarboxylase/2,5-furandicarboxylate decarboxylase 1